MHTVMMLCYVPTKVIQVCNKESLGCMINAGMLLASMRRLIFSGSVIALWLTAKSLFALKWELMKPTQKPSISLVTETGLFLWMSNPLRMHQLQGVCRRARQCDIDSSGTRTQCIELWRYAMFQPKSSRCITRKALVAWSMHACFCPQGWGSSSVDLWSLSG